jgi:hypothetical protein
MRRSVPSHIGAEPGVLRREDERRLIPAQGLAVQAVGGDPRRQGFRDVLQQSLTGRWGPVKPMQ